MVRSVAAFLLVLALLPGCVEGDADDDPAVAEASRVAAAYVCTDERDRARDLSTVYLDTSLGWLPFQHGEPVVARWGGTPFVVDVSSTFPNADALLEVVAQEAAHIHAVLGYEIFVAGDVVRLADVTASDLTDPDVALQLTPLHPYIDVLCCYDGEPQVMGVANPHLRVVVLRNDAFGSRYAIVHEFYHLLGFVHPGGTEGVVMSEALMYGTRDSGERLPLPTRSTPLDLARLACIYD